MTETNELPHLPDECPATGEHALAHLAEVDSDLARKDWAQAEHNIMTAHNIIQHLRAAT